MSCFSIIVASLAKSVPIFGGLDDSYISGWLIGNVSIMDNGACIFWMIDLKVFCNCSSFSQSSTILVF